MTLTRGLRRIVAGNAGMMTGPGTNTYLLGESEITVVDPGPLEAAHLHAILNAAGAPIRFILATIKAVNGETRAQFGRSTGSF